MLQNKNSWTFKSCVCACVLGCVLGVLGPPTCLLIGYKDLQVFGAGHTHSWGLFQGRGVEQGQQSKEGHWRSLERWAQLLSLSLLGCTVRRPFPPPPRQVWESRSGMPEESQVCRYVAEPSSSSLCSLHNRPASWEMRGHIERNNVSKQPPFQGLDATFFYRTESRRRGGRQVKRPLILQISLECQPQRKCVYFSFLTAIHRWTGSGCFPEQRHFSLTFRQRAELSEGGHYGWTVSF